MTEFDVLANRYIALVCDLADTTTVEQMEALQFKSTLCADVEHVRQLRQLVGDADRALANRSDLVCIRERVRGTATAEADLAAVAFSLRVVEQLVKRRLLALEQYVVECQDDAIVVAMFIRHKEKGAPSARAVFGSLRKTPSACRAFGKEIQ